MAKAKAPRWLTEAFRDGVDELHRAQVRELRPMFSGQSTECWLARHDPRGRPCSGRWERFHWINRQRVEAVIWEKLRGASMVDSEGFPLQLAPIERDALILLAAWDARNGGVSCEHHHRRLDSHLTPELKVPAFALPQHVDEFVGDYELQTEAENRFEGFADPDRAYLWTPR